MSTIHQINSIDYSTSSTTSSSGIINIVPSPGQAPTIHANGTGTTTTTTTTGSTFYVNPTQSWSSLQSLKVGEYALSQENERLVIRDKLGHECLAIKNGTLMIGNQTIHEVILDIIDMVNGNKSFSELLVDPDQSKRELGQQIYKRRRKRKAQTPST